MHVHHLFLTVFIFKKSGKDAQDALRYRILSAKEPLIIKFVCGQCPIQIRNPISVCHSVVADVSRIYFHRRRLNIYIYTYIHVFIYIYTHEYRDIFMHTHAHDHLRLTARLSILAHRSLVRFHKTRRNIYMYTFTFTWTYICMSTHLHMYVHVYIYIYMYTFTYTASTHLHM